MGAVGGENGAVLNVEIVAIDGDDVRVIVAGELDISNVEVFEREVAPVLTRLPKHLVIDAGELTFADSSGIALWVRLAGAVDQFELLNPSPLLRRVIVTMGLASKLGVRP